MLAIMPRSHTSFPSPRDSLEKISTLSVCEVPYEMKPADHHPRALPDHDREGGDRGRIHVLVGRQHQHELDQQRRGDQRHEAEAHQLVWRSPGRSSSATALPSATSSRKAKIPASTASGPSATCLTPRMPAMQTIPP